jgi:hypothetical protein
MVDLCDRGQGARFTGKLGQLRAQEWERIFSPVSKRMKLGKDRLFFGACWQEW